MFWHILSSFHVVVLSSQKAKAVSAMVSVAQSRAIFVPYLAAPTFPCQLATITVRQGCKLEAGPMPPERRLPDPTKPKYPIQTAGWQRRTPDQHKSLEHVIPPNSTEHEDLSCILACRLSLLYFHWESHRSQRFCLTLVDAVRQDDGKRKSSASYVWRGERGNSNNSIWQLPWSTQALCLPLNGYLDRQIDRGNSFDDLN